MKCHYCKKREAKLMWFVYQVCPKCWAQRMEQKKHSTAVDSPSKHLNY